MTWPQNVTVNKIIYSLGLKRVKSRSTETCHVCRHVRHQLQSKLQDQHLHQQILRSSDNIWSCCQKHSPSPAAFVWTQQPAAADGSSAQLRVRGTADPSFKPTHPLKECTSPPTAHGRVSLQISLQNRAGTLKRTENLPSCLRVGSLCFCWLSVSSDIHLQLLLTPNIKQQMQWFYSKRSEKSILHEIFC